MVIIVEDSKTGKQFKITGAGHEFMIYRKAECEIVNGKAMTKNGKEKKNDWTFTGLYPTTLGSAVYQCVNRLLADPDDDDQVVIEAEKARVQFGKILKTRIDQIEAKVLKEADDGATD